MLAYEMQGQGTGVVFLHGFAGSRGQWHTYLPRAAEAGFAAYALDLPGHGQSPPPARRPVSTLDWAQAVIRWLQTRFPQPVHLVGHSLGGYLALAYAIQHPQRVASLTLFAPLLSWHAIHAVPRLGLRLANLLPWLPERWPPGVRWFWRVALWFYPEAWHMRPSQRARRVAEIAAMSPRAMWALGRVPDLRPQVVGLPVRTWVIGGARDSVLNPASYAALGDLLPQAQVHLWPHVGHIPHLTEAEVLRDQLIRWLQGYPPEAPGPQTASTRAGST